MVSITANGQTVQAQIVDEVRITVLDLYEFLILFFSALILAQTTLLTYPQVFSLISSAALDKARSMTVFGSFQMVLRTPHRHRRRANG